MKKRNPKKILLVSGLIVLLLFGIFYYIYSPPSCLYNRGLSSSAIANVNKILNNAEIWHLEGCDEFFLYALNPTPASFTEEDTGKKIPEDQVFHDYPILGKLQLQGEDKETVLNQFYSSIGSSPFGALCFEPRHGIHALYGNLYIDLVICFECIRVEIYTNLGSSQHFNIFGNSEVIQSWNKLLTDAKIPISLPMNEKKK
ncbi:MAG: hypothetical protein AABZ60_01410 [Planctomycetota bacterium]